MWGVVVCLWVHHLAVGLFYAVAITGLYALYVALAGLAIGIYNACGELVGWIKGLISRR